MSARHSYTFTVPPEMHRVVERVRKTEQRTTTELMREALRYYFARVGALPTYTPTKAELRALAKGRAAFERGDFVTLDEFNTYVDRLNRKARAQDARPRKPARARATPKRHQRHGR